MRSIFSIRVNFSAFSDIVFIMKTFLFSTDFDKTMRNVLFPHIPIAFKIRNSSARAIRTFIRAWLNCD